MNDGVVWVLGAVCAGMALALIALSVALYKLVFQVLNNVIREIQKTRHSIHNLHQAILGAPIREIPDDNEEPETAYDSGLAPTIDPVARRR